MTTPFFDTGSLFDEALFGGEEVELFDGPDLFDPLLFDTASGGLVTVTKDFAVSWDVRTTVTKDHAISWDVRQTVTKDFPASWDVRQTVAKDFHVSWNVDALGLTTVTKDFGVSWDVRQTVAKDQPVSWDVRQTVTKDQPISWDVRQTVARDLPMSWSVRETVGRDFSISWNVESERFIVTRDFGVSWNVEGALKADDGGDGGSSSKSRDARAPDGGLVRQRAIEAFASLEERRAAAKALPKRVIANDEREKIKRKAAQIVEAGVRDKDAALMIAKINEADAERRAWLDFYLRVAVYQWEQIQQALADGRLAADTDDEEVLLLLL